jgi:hypothetical protein
LFLERLVAAYDAGHLQFFGEHAPLSERDAFTAHLTPLRKADWVVYAKRPFGGPEAVLAYLSRYTHRVAIANSRLIAIDDAGVTFRWKDYHFDLVVMGCGDTAGRTNLANQITPLAKPRRNDKNWATRSSTQRVSCGILSRGPILTHCCFSPAPRSIKRPKKNDPPSRSPIKSMRMQAIEPGACRRPEFAEMP